MNFIDFIKALPSKIIYFFQHLGENGIFAIWMSSIFIAGILVLGLTTVPRSRALANSANKTLETIGDTRRLTAPVPAWGLSGSDIQAGSWFTTDENNLACIWTLPIGGIFAPFLTLFTNAYEIEKTVPLSKTASVFAIRTTEGVPDIWQTRVWNAAKSIGANRQRKDG